MLKNSNYSLDERKDPTSYITIPIKCLGWYSFQRANILNKGDTLNFMTVVKVISILERET